MKTKRFNWAYIIIGIVGLLMASCAEDDEDVDLTPRMKMPEFKGTISLDSAKKKSEKAPKKPMDKPATSEKPAEAPKPAKDDFDIAIKPGDDFDI